ncbi:MAG TPA: p-hydroxycinnamoyl CoA hydratase/lyase [Pseudonocardiaceae bacterium]|jgi:trans-feruloyl-CoA hydratase/vanillin synthase|nr:p-hydroxycinnamoyl CoA hydratase/lyase [Pseudonocardiaceae bacterium]
MTQYETIRIERDAAPGVTILTFDRPDQRNAMNPLLHEEMTAALDELWYDDKTRVLVLTGEGTAFCAGMDLKQSFLDLQDKPREYDRMLRQAVEWRGRTLRLFPKPTIAMVNGYCFGGAFSIVESCDLAVAAETAKFGLSEINFGMFPAGCVSKSLGNAIDRKTTLLHAMTGRPFDGTRAAEIGLVNYAVPSGELRKNVLELAAEIARRDPEALRATKEVYLHSVQMEWDAAMSYSSARERQVSQAQGNAWLDTHLTAFANGEYKPGLGARQAGE